MGVPSRMTGAVGGAQASVREREQAAVFFGCSYQLYGHVRNTWYRPLDTAWTDCPCVGVMFGQSSR